MDDYSASISPASDRWKLNHRGLVQTGALAGQQPGIETKPDHAGLRHYPAPLHTDRKLAQTP